jgi:hypothetical protein
MTTRQKTAATLVAVAAAALVYKVNRTARDGWYSSAETCLAVHSRL